MFGSFSDKVRRWAAFGLAGGVVFVDSASRIFSMVGDLILVSLLLLVLLAGKPKRGKHVQVSDQAVSAQATGGAARAGSPGCFQSCAAAQTTWESWPARASPARVYQRSAARRHLQPPRASAKSRQPVALQQRSHAFPVALRRAWEQRFGVELLLER
jgi:hypothetical protein